MTCYWRHKSKRIVEVLFLLSVLFSWIAEGDHRSDASDDTESSRNRFDLIRASKLDLATWIKRGFQQGQGQEHETEETQVCLGSNLMHTLFQLIAENRPGGKEGKEDTQRFLKVDLYKLTDDQLELLCSLLCGWGICPPGCPENSNPCPWGCGPDKDQ